MDKDTVNSKVQAQRQKIADYRAAQDAKIKAPSEDPGPRDDPNIDPGWWSVLPAGLRREQLTLPVGSQERKDIPIVTGLLDYFPAALAEIAKVSKAGNDKHNPGQPLHWARGKSTDQADCIGRHLLERGGFDPETGQRHTAQMAWRALALLQLELEAAGAPIARGAA